MVSPAEYGYLSVTYGETRPRRMTRKIRHNVARNPGGCRVDRGESLVAQFAISAGGYFRQERRHMIFAALSFSLYIQPQYFCR